MAAVSERRRRIEISNGRFGAMVRPANYEEINRCITSAKTDKVGAHVRLFDAVNVDKAQLPPAACFSLGLAVVKISGGESFASEVKPDDLPEKVAEAFVERQDKDPKASFLAFRVADEGLVEYFLVREPEPARFDAYLKAKTNGSGIDADLAFVKQHRFYGDLEVLQREAPLAISSLANAIAEVGGICLEASLGEA